MGTSHGVDRHAHNMIEINETFPLSLPLIPFDLHDPNLNIFHKIWTNSFLRGRKRIPIDPQDLQYCILMNFTFGKRWDVWVQPTFLEAHPGHSRSSLRTSLFFAIVWGKFNGPAQEELFWGRGIYWPLVRNKWFHSCPESGSKDIKAHQTMTFSILFPMFFCKTSLVFPSFLMLKSMFFCRFFQPKPMVNSPRLGAETPQFRGSTAAAARCWAGSRAPSQPGKPSS